jgi:flagellin-specific chaperone FliS
MTRSIRAYRSSAIEGATHIDILLACYDALAEDIRLAGKSAVAGDVAARCRYSDHALLLIGHLESWVVLLDDSELAANLVSFYSYLRAEILRLQLSAEFDKFVNLALVVGETRATWQRKQNTALSQIGTTSASMPSKPESGSSASRLLVSI